MPSVPPPQPELPSFDMAPLMRLSWDIFAAVENKAPDQPITDPEGVVAIKRWKHENGKAVQINFTHPAEDHGPVVTKHTITHALRLLMGDGGGIEIRLMPGTIGNIPSIKRSIDLALLARNLNTDTIPLLDNSMIDQLDAWLEWAEALLMNAKGLCEDAHK